VRALARPSQDCPWWEFARCRPRLGAAREPAPRPVRVAYDGRTDEFLFQLPGEAERLRFLAFVVDPAHGDTKVWAVIGTFSANDPNSGDQP
jgi:hypothetical protein